MTLLEITLRAPWPAVAAGLGLLMFAAGVVLWRNRRK